MSAPASRNRRWMSPIISGLVSENRSPLFRRLFVASLNRSPRISASCHAIGTNRRAHRSIDDGDATIEDLFQRMLVGLWSYPFDDLGQPSLQPYLGDIFHEICLLYYSDGQDVQAVAGVITEVIVIALNARDFPEWRIEKEYTQQPSSLPLAECPSSRRVRSRASAACLSPRLRRQFVRSPNSPRKFLFGRSCLNSHNRRVSSARASVLSKI